MKKVIILAISLILSMVGFSQTWYGNNPTFNDGFIGSVSFTGNATIKGHVTFTNGGSFANIAITDNSTLTLTETTTFTGGYLIENGGKIIAKKDLTLTTGGAWFMSIMNGVLEVDGKLEVTGAHIRFLDVCAVIIAKDFSYHTDNIIDATSGATGGLLYVSGTFSNEYQNSFYTGHPLTTLSSVFVNTTNAIVNLGSAQRTTLTQSPCTITTPVTFSASPKVTAIYENYVTVEFKVANESQIARYNVQFSRDGGKTWEMVAVVIPNNTTLNKTYSVNINLYK